MQSLRATSESPKLSVDVICEGHEVLLVRLPDFKVVAGPWGQVLSWQWRQKTAEPTCG